MDLLFARGHVRESRKKSWKEDFISESKAAEDLVLQFTKVVDEADVSLDKENWKEQIQERNTSFKSKLGNLSQVMDVSRAKKYQAELSRIPEESDNLQEDLIPYNNDQQGDDLEEDFLSLDLSLSTYSLSQDFDLSTCDVVSEIERLQRQKSILEGRIRETKQKLDLPYRTRNQTNTYRLQLKRMAAKSEALDKKIEFEMRNGERRNNLNESGGWMKVRRNVKHLSVVGLTSKSVTQKRKDSLASSGDGKRTPILFSVVRAAQLATGSGKTKPLTSPSPVETEQRSENDRKRSNGLMLNTQNDEQNSDHIHSVVKPPQAKQNCKVEDEQLPLNDQKGRRRVSVPRYDYPPSEEDRWAHPLWPLAREMAQKKVKVATTKFLPPIPNYQAKRRPKTPKTETLIDENDSFQQEVRMILVPNRRRVAEGRAKMYTRQLDFAKFHDLTRKDIEEGIKYALEDCDNTERVHRDKNLAIRRSRRHSLHMIGSLSRRHLYPPGTPEVKP